MNKLSKILLVIILILTITLIATICLYYEKREESNEFLNNIKFCEWQIQAIKGKINEKATIEYVKTIENIEERAKYINTYLEFDMLTEDVAKDLY